MEWEYFWMSVLFVIKLRELHAIATWIDQRSELGVRLPSSTLSASCIFFFALCVFSVRTKHRQIRQKIYENMCAMCVCEQVSFYCVGDSIILGIANIPTRCSFLCLSHSFRISFVSIKEWKKEKEFAERNWGQFAHSVHTARYLLLSLPFHTFNTRALSSSRSLLLPLSLCIDKSNIEILQNL